jgi:hypothetical protein
MDAQFGKINEYVALFSATKAPKGLQKTLNFVAKALGTKEH